MSTLSESSPAVVRRAQKGARQRALPALVFIAPAAVVFAIFVLAPLAQTVWLSFTDWSGFSDQVGWRGFGNYGNVLSDPAFYAALGRSVYFTLIHVVIAGGGGLILAVLISRVSRGHGAYRTLFFFPKMLSLAVVGVTWSQLYNPSVGAINQALEFIGLGSLTHAWLGEESTALTAVAIASAWNAYGFYMVIFLASLQGIDPQLYEAAALDGAGGFKRFIHVTVPGLYNTISMVLVLAIISGLKGFGTVWAMTQGGPVKSTELVMVYIWRNAFSSGGDLGRSLAASIVFGVVVIIVTVSVNVYREKREQKGGR